ncbi:MAG TPA: hypothetical protein VF860_05765 [Candidatus Acidoferrales bacterium]
MESHRKYLVGVGVLLILALVLTQPTHHAAAKGDDVQLIAASSLLAGLAPGAAFPFIDTTPHTITRAHVAVTDATPSCGGASPTAPSNVQVLVGQAGVALVPVMTAATNTGISTTTGQCVFHVTINAGQAGVPPAVTDIVVLNGGSAALTGINTVTASATVRVHESE